MGGNALFDGQRVLIKAPAGMRAGRWWEAMEFHAEVHGNHAGGEAGVRLKTTAQPGGWLTVPRAFVSEAVMTDGAEQVPRG